MAKTTAAKAAAIMETLRSASSSSTFGGVAEARALCWRIGAWFFISFGTFEGNCLSSGG